MSVSPTYQLVGCSKCDGIKIVKGDPETTECTQCGKRLNFRKLRVLYETDDHEQATKARAEILAKINGYEDEFDSIADSGALDERDETNVEYIFNEQKGIPDDETESTKSLNRYERIVDIIETNEPVDKSTVMDIAETHGISPDDTEDLIQKLINRAEVLQGGEGLKLL